MRRNISLSLCHWTPEPRLVKGLFRYSDEDGIVVGGESALIAAEGDLLRGIGRFLLVNRCAVGGPISIGEDSIGIDACLRRNEDVVDARRGVEVGLEAVEGAGLGKPQSRGEVAVFQDSGLGEDAVDFVVLVDVEVAGEDDGCSLGDVADALHDELSGFAACRSADVVHMEVEEKEFLLGPHVLELSPRADANAGGIPAETGLLWRLAEPEVAVVEESDMVFLVEDGGIFAFGLAVVTAHTDIVVAVEALQEVEELRVKHFLCAEDVGGEEINLIADDRAALFPTVAALVVFLVLVTDIVGAHEHLGGNIVSGERGEEEEEKKEEGRFAT